MQYVSRRGVIWLLAAGGVAGILAWEILTPPKVEHPVVGGAPDGRALFAAHCAECHGDAGKGDGPGAKIVRTPMTDFTNAAAMANRDDHFLAEIIKKGGSQFGRSNAMPAWGMKLSDEEIRALVVFIRSQAHPNPAVSSEKK